MMKTISLSLRKLVTFPKFKMKKNGRVYDKEWNTVTPLNRKKVLKKN